MDQLKEHCDEAVNETMIFDSHDNEIDRINKFTKSFSQFKHAFKQIDKTRKLEKSSLKLIDGFQKIKDRLLMKVKPAIEFDKSIKYHPTVKKYLKQIGMRFKRWFQTIKELL